MLFDQSVPLSGVVIGQWKRNEALTAGRDVTTDLGFLDAIGGPPFDNAALAAVFDPDRFRPGLDLLAYWTLPDRSRVVSGARLTDADLRSWR